MPNTYDINYFAMMQREVGMRQHSRYSVFNEPKVQKATISETVQGQPCCLVTKKLYDWQKESIMKDKDKIYNLVTTPGLDYREFAKNSELQKCWKRGTSRHQGTFTHRRTVVDGIKLRAKENFPNDPTYEERQIKELDKMLENNIRILYFSILSDES